MGQEPPIVTDLVIDVQLASGQAVVRHLLNFLDVSSRTSELDALTEALDHGYDVDLDDFTSPDQLLGFDHGLISDIFSRKLQRYAGKNPRRHPIWEADEERGIFSLFGRPGKGDRDVRARKTRVSLIVQRSMRDSRSFRQAEKATTAITPSKLVTVPSPLHIAAQILSDPHRGASGVYAKAALQEWIKWAIENADGKTIDMSFGAVSEALATINNRWRTSKPISSNRSANGATTIFLCNLFAIHGYMAMRINLSDLARTGRPARDPAIIDAYFQSLVLGSATEEKAEFLVNPHFSSLPSSAEVMNLIDGLPIAIEGAETIFQGGIRLSPDKSVVAAISGTFGAGKTFFGLSLAAALAPLGCRTLFLSCEESAVDIETRITEIASATSHRASHFYRGIDDGTRAVPHNRSSGDSPPIASWFMARQMRLEQTVDGQESLVVDPASALSAMLEDTISQAAFFRPWASDSKGRLPHFARPVVIIDGLHQLFDLPQGEKVIEASLRNLVERCRSLGAIFLFSFSKEAAGLRRLEYLCDLIIELDRGGFDNPADTPRRFFQLLKARRQPARIGAHVFHLKGDNGFRLKPSLNARVEQAKAELWWEPDPRAEIFLTDDTPPGFRGGSLTFGSNSAQPIRNRGQILVIGKGSSGKAGFGLYLLHRRWFDRRMFSDETDSRQLSFPDNKLERSLILDHVNSRKRVINDAKLPIWYTAPPLETRVLVISFLYQRSYYDTLTARLKARRRGRASRSGLGYGPISGLNGIDYTPMPDRMRTDTIELYPGMLSVEDFVAKVEKQLSSAEALGLPYTGVLIDGIHNVFVQFPGLEQVSSFWGMFFNILRRRRVTVVTTHTEFEVHGTSDVDGAQRAHEEGLLKYDFEQAQRKIAPLLSVLVSGSDYLFEISAKHVGRNITYRVTPRGSIGYDVGNIHYAWEKTQLRLEAVTGPDPKAAIAETKRTLELEDAASAIARLSEALGRPLTKRRT